jgi:hypothetical protein
VFKKIAKNLVPTLVPGIPPIPKDASPELRAYLTALGEALQVRLGRRGDPRDRAVTLRELVDSGLAKELKTKQFDPNNYVASNLGFATNTTPNLAVPPAPAGLSGSAAFQTVILTWNSAKDPSFLYSNHSLTNIYRHTSDNIGDAVFVGSTPAAIFADDTVSSGQIYYYWVRYISTDSIEGPFNATSGVAVTATNVNAITTTMITDDAITTAKIAAGTITADSAILANAAVVNAKIADAAITTAKISDANITTAKIYDAAITTAKINDAAINTAKIGAAAVNTLSIGGNAVTVPQFATATSSNLATSSSYSSAIVSTSFTFSGLASSATGGVIAMVSVQHAPADSSVGTGTIGLHKGGSVLSELNYTYSGSGGSQSLFAFTTQENGSITYDVRIKTSGSKTSTYIINIVMLGAKR